MTAIAALEFRVLGPELEGALEEFFAELEASETTKYFHPHPFTAEEAKKLCHRQGKDLYYAAIVGGRILGYGMLRGWDEGYEVPSLGIAFRPGHRGVGLGKSFMVFLHAAARLRGAKRIRLKVYPDNAAAVTMYKSLGYHFEEALAGQLVGYLDLAPRGHREHNCAAEPSAFE